MSWFVIQVRTGSEQTVCDKIRMRVPQKLWEDCFVPQIENIYKKAGEYRKVIRPLFPGYVFVVCEEPVPVAAALQAVPDFARLLKSGEAFVPLCPNEVDYLMKLAGENRKVEMSTGYIVGDKICITEGPMRGLDGDIRKIDRHKRVAWVNIPFMGGYTQVQLPLEIVSKV